MRVQGVPEKPQDFMNFATVIHHGQCPRSYDDTLATEERPKLRNPLCENAA